MYKTHVQTNIIPDTGQGINFYYIDYGVSMVYLGYTTLAGTQTVGCWELVITLKYLYSRKL